MKVVVIATHPDDEVLGCGGVMARHAACGDEVHVIVVTRGIPELYPVSLVEQTRNEFRAAVAVLKVTGTAFLDFPAPKLDTVPHFQLADAIAGVIRRVGAEMVYIPHHGDIHVDHRMVYMASLVACRPVNNCPVKRLLAYETLSETEWAPAHSGDAFIPTVFVDVTPFMPQKLEALRCYASQIRPAPNSRSTRTVEALAAFRGGTVSVMAAEAFMLIRDVVLLDK
jgi:N-acetylglucosamine malate deacetylase 1